MDNCKEDKTCKLIYSLYSNINDDLVKQNNKLDSELQNLNAEHSTDYQKSNYQIANIDDYKYYNTILFWLYYLIVTVIIFITITQMEANIAIKILIIFAFVTYPLLINNIEILLYELILYFWAFISGSVYTKPEL